MKMVELEIVPPQYRYFVVGAYEDGNEKVDDDHGKYGHEYREERTWKPENDIICARLVPLEDGKRGVNLVTIYQSKQRVHGRLRRLKLHNKTWPFNVCCWNITLCFT